MCAARRSLVLTGLLTAAVATSCCAAEFTATRVSRTVGPGGVVLASARSRVSVKGRNVRQDFSIGARPPRSAYSLICRHDKNVVWRLDPPTKTYRVVQTEGSLWRDVPGMTLGVPIGREPGSPRSVGQARVSGYDCDKFAYAYSPTAPDRQAGSHLIRVMTWRARKLGVTIRAVVEGAERAGQHTVIELTDIRERKLSDSLFELPAEYREARHPRAVGAPASSALGR